MRAEDAAFIATIERGLEHVRKHLPAMRERAERRPWDDRRKLAEYESALAEYEQILADAEQGKEWIMKDG